MKLFQRFRAWWHWFFTKEPVPRKLTIPLVMNLTRAEWVDRPANPLYEDDIPTREFVVEYMLEHGMGPWRAEFRIPDGDAGLPKARLLAPMCVRAVLRDIQWTLAQQGNRFPDSHDGEDMSLAEESTS